MPLARAERPALAPLSRRWLDSGSSGIRKSPSRTSGSTAFRSRKPRPSSWTRSHRRSRTLITPRTKRARSRRGTRDGAASWSWLTRRGMVECESSPQGAPLRASGGSMKKKTQPKKSEELRPEYDFSQLGAGVVGKYYERCKAGPIVVLLKAEDGKPTRRSAAPRPSGPTGAARKRKKSKRVVRRATRRS